MKMLFLLMFLMHKVVTLRCPSSEAFPLPHEWFQPGDLVIGGMVSQIFYNFYEIEFKEHPSLNPYDLSLVITKFYQHVLALAFAVKEINEDSQILPNITLGFHIYDSYYNPSMTYRSTLDLLFKSQEFVPNYKCDTQKNLMAIIGGLDAPTSSYMAQVISIFKIPQSLVHSLSCILYLGQRTAEVHSREVKGFKEFLQVIKPSTHKDGFLQEVWQQLFDCVFSKADLPSSINGTCSGEENLENLPAPLFELKMTSQSYSIYNAVYAVAHSLHEAVRSSPKWTKIQRVEFPNLQPWQVLPVSFCNDHCSPGSWKRRAEGNQFCCYDCIPCLEGKISNGTDMDDCFECSEDHYPNKEKKGCILKRLIFLTFEETLGIGLASAALCFFLLTSWILGTFIKHRDTPIVRANNRSLTYTLLVSLFFCFLSSFLFLSQPGKVTCLLRQPTFGITFSVAISSVLAKTITVVVAFMATKPGSQMRKWVGKRLAFAAVLSSSLVQVCICTLWLSTYPPFPELEMHLETQEVILQCNEGAATFFYCVLGYMGFLAIASFIVAFFARKLPDSFNEAKFITFSMLAFCSVWVSFLPAYLSTKGKAMIAVEVFSILSSSAALLGCIFLPKCYIIVLRPELNHRVRSTINNKGSSTHKICSKHMVRIYIPILVIFKIKIGTRIALQTEIDGLSHEGHFQIKSLD
ncbi:vomeronasal type-2 receptor 26-like [Crotalus tigris]|uniref:vomeronasal type-2 receptor 26-like n=1 Tax=Crotalus tigris TaxID=88082 RepID=UPI00192F5E42|nr:vomeronasal type-2 receptor 26-like [Crotalus tigris]